MKVRLGNDVAVDLYCCVRQAGLSLDRALSAAIWPALLDYYDQRRRSWLGAILRGLEAPTGERHEPALNRTERPRNPGTVTTALARLFGRFRRSIVLSSDEVRFFVETLTDLLELLDSRNYPGRDTLIALRLNLSAGEALLDHKCGSMTGLNRCRGIEHFNQAPHLSTVSIASILPMTDQPHAHKAQPT